ncbi:hypothetical protein CALCODRAFT_484202 [Calocera cornea HHB12733]|uniref:GATA-type domain-containing protein n=1 Tax=Calocera cornea HHB12733 TaxID=1353952 RepID=A0A165F4R3_9BASI|nr:hypothetical protein CALCODRAFT_484202 [Calocera cornea HHB12733]
MSSSGLVKREPSPEPMRLRTVFSPEPRSGPGRRDLAPPPSTEPAPYSRMQAPSWRVQSSSATAASPSGSAGQRSWLSTVQNNDPEADRSDRFERFDRFGPSSPSGGATSSVFPSYGAPNTPMRPNQRHAPGYTCPDCETTHTAAWRWYEGRKYCNACGLHRKANGKKRSERLIEQDKQRRLDKERAEREFLNRIDAGGAIKREGTAQ